MAKGDRVRALPAFRALRPPVRRRTPLPPLAPIFPSPCFALSALPYGGAPPSPPPPSLRFFLVRTAWRYRPPLTLRPLLLRFVAATSTLSSLGNTVASSGTTRRCSPRRPFVLSAFVVTPLRLRSPCCLSRPIALRLLSPCCLSRPTSRLPSPVLSAFSCPVACPVRHPVWEVALCRRSCGPRLFLHRTFSAVQPGVASSYGRRVYGSAFRVLRERRRGRTGGRARGAPTQARVERAGERRPLGEAPGRAGQRGPAQTRAGAELCCPTSPPIPLPYMAEILCKLIEDCAGLKGYGSEIVLDLFSGTGTIGLTPAQKVRHVYGYEVVVEAISDAQRNDELNGIHNATLFKKILIKLMTLLGMIFQALTSSFQAYSKPAAVWTACSEATTSWLDARIGPIN
ncbi:uncharacterized protein LOC109717997 [Ananas comosus]|uniref:Uncharacterized protein LOC109717997 n=1 Tax=Ananas comosus TaxID=4615 RepID=A0A6P5G1K9_ANACO|nr:uncharacterized protein LOC109717997 [Ananas comosus]